MRWPTTTAEPTRALRTVTSDMDKPGDSRTATRTDTWIQFAMLLVVLGSAIATGVITISERLARLESQVETMTRLLFRHMDQPHEKK